MTPACAGNFSHPEISLHPAEVTRRGHQASNPAQFSPEGDRPRSSAVRLQLDEDITEWRKPSSIRQLPLLSPSTRMSMFLGVGARYPFVLSLPKERPQHRSPTEPSKDPPEVALATEGCALLLPKEKSDTPCGFDELSFICVDPIPPVPSPTTTRVHEFNWFLGGVVLSE